MGKGKSFPGLNDGNTTWGLVLRWASCLKSESWNKTSWEPAIYWMLLTMSIKSKIQPKLTYSHTQDDFNQSSERRIYDRLNQEYSLKYDWQNKTLFSYIDMIHCSVTIYLKVKYYQSNKRILQNTSSCWWNRQKR